MLRYYSFFVIAAGLIMFSPMAYSVSLVTFCNKSGNELRVATAREHYYKGRDVWLENGWKIIPNNGCVDVIGRLGSNYWAAFAFMSIVNGKKTFPYYKPGKTHPPPFSSQHICANLNKNYSYPLKEISEVGNNCPEGAQPIRLSFFVRGGHNNVNITLD